VSYCGGRGHNNTSQRLCAEISSSVWYEIIHEHSTLASPAMGHGAHAPVDFQLFNFSWHFRSAQTGTRLRTVAYPVKITLLVLCPLAPNPGDRDATVHEVHNMKRYKNRKNGKLSVEVPFRIKSNSSKIDQLPQHC